ncbi:MAG: beta-ketoacyl-ACP synthase II [Anaerolineales bacterium]|nr:MAG: beta-ketoacyl-ACP synthase II [Anaerolineales bacterium]
MSRVLVTGLGAITPIGNDVPTFWRNLTNGVSGAGAVSAFDASEFPVRIACEVKDFDPAQWMDRKMTRRTARGTQFALAATKQALDDAGLTIDADNRDNIGVVIATGGGGIGLVEEGTHILIDKGPRAVSPFLLPGLMPNAVSCLVSIETGARGPILTSTLACASGNYSVIEGYNFLQRGEADVIIVGGAESTTTPLGFAALGRMGALSSRNDDPQHASRPFDADRDGFVYGEGAAIMILETEQHARARGVEKVYAEVLGGRLTGDAFHITAPDPEGDGAVRAMKGAMQSAGLQPTDVNVIFAHGTSTPLNDVTETRAIKRAFGDYAYDLAVTGTKSMVGHMMGAAGAVAATAAALTLYEGIIPPTINQENPDPECDLDYVPNQARRAEVNAALVNAFGFGGQNVVLAMKRYSS